MTEFFQDSAFLISRPSSTAQANKTGSNVIRPSRGSSELMSNECSLSTNQPYQDCTHLSANQESYGSRYIILFAYQCITNRPWDRWRFVENEYIFAPLEFYISKERIRGGNMKILILHIKCFRLMYKLSVAQKYTRKIPIPWTNCTFLDQMLVNLYRCTNGTILKQLPPPHPC